MDGTSLEESQEFVPVARSMEEDEEDGQAGEGDPEWEERGDFSGGPSARTVACELCRTERAKYCCPGCCMRTCSLQCSKQHKAVTGCTGQRDRLAFVTLQQFDDKKLLSGALMQLAYFQECF
jgi:hypothetical protein